jgi:hypothetical protein
MGVVRWMLLCGGYCCEDIHGIMNSFPLARIIRWAWPNLYPWKLAIVTALLAILIFQLACAALDFSCYRPQHYATA